MPMTVTEIVAELRGMLALAGDSPSIVRRTQRSALTVLHELVDDRGEIVPWSYRLAAGVGTLTPGALDYDACDIVIRTTPADLHRILSGELGGREAVVSGILDLRKAPSMAKLLVMRALFNRYLKLRRGGEPAAGPAVAETASA